MKDPWGKASAAEKGAGGGRSARVGQVLLTQSFFKAPERAVHLK